jgi:hypothetical protein
MKKIKTVVVPIIGQTRKIKASWTVEEDLVYDFDKVENEKNDTRNC